ncbi:head-tail joining protein [Escherichia fergusonii]|uniref:head-tail joining protein n=1 Tax=Escherichia fergusonii TaxID=564 RepID=UPI0020181D16|nr:head-tail joining protein [Escherichia fergusonii]
MCASRLLMGNFHERLMRAEARITRLFAQPYPAVLYIGNECRQVNVIFETPDAPVSVPGGGEISNHAPAFSAMTADIVGLSRHDEVLVNNIRYRVTHVGANEVGRTRVTLAYGAPGNVQPPIEQWS